MKFKELVLIGVFFSFSLNLQAQQLEEDFTAYNSRESVNSKFDISENFELLYSDDGSKQLKFDNSFSLVYKIPLTNIGKLEVKTLIDGPAKWEVAVLTGTSTDFGNSNNWKEIAKANLNNRINNYTTTSLDLNFTESQFIKFAFTVVGENSQLTIDRILLKDITKDAEQKIINKKLQEENKELRKQEIQSFIANKSYNDARVLLNTYKSDYKKRIDALGKLSRKTVAIELVSGTAGQLGNYNQLSNPLNYKKFEVLKGKLFKNLEPIDRLYFNDEIEGRLNGFFTIMEQPLNIVAGIGDIFTGGAVSRLVNGFKGLITKGYSTERLETIGFNSKKKLTKEKAAGLKLYEDANVFFDEIERQNQKTLALNQNILSIYGTAADFNTRVNQELQNYLAFENIVVAEDSLMRIIKNEAEAQLHTAIDKSFDNLLGTERSFSVNEISSHIKKLDLLFAKTDDLIKEYATLSNSMNSYYSDFNSVLKDGCPFSNLEEEDQKYWDKNVNQVNAQMTELQNKFMKMYVNVEFITD